MTHVRYRRWGCFRANETSDGQRKYALLELVGVAAASRFFPNRKDGQGTHSFGRKAGVAGWWSVRIFLPVTCLPSSARAAAYPSLVVQNYCTADTTADGLALCVSLGAF